MNENNNTEPVVYAVGTRGYSAYEVAVQNGFIGTEQEWLDSLVGPQGPQGQPFDELTPEQKAEITGPEGKSAYEVAVDEGYEGTEEDFVNSYINADNYYNKQQVDEQMNDITDNLEQINSQVQHIDEKVTNATSGSPKGAYATLSDLTTADPDHDYIYVVLADGNWYYYDSTLGNWASGGVYQAVSIADNSVTSNKLSSILQNMLYITEADFTVTEGSFVDARGNIASNASFCHTSPIELKKGQTIDMFAQGYQQNVSMITECDIDGENRTVLVLSEDSTARTYTYTAPKDMYVMLSYYKSRLYELNIGVYIKEIFSELNDVEDKFKPDIDYDIVSGEFITARGAIAHSANYTRTSPFYLGAGCNIEINARGYQQNVSMISRCDENGENITPVVISIDSTQRIYHYEVLEEGYFIISYETAGSAKFSMSILYELDIISKSIDYVNNKINMDKTNNILHMFNNITCIGDSLTYSAVYVESNRSRQAYKPYPTILGNILNIPCENISRGGATATSWWNEFSDSIVEKTNQLAIVYLGTNSGLTDTIDTDCVGDDYTQYADTNTGNYGKIIQKLLDNNSKVIIVRCYENSSTFDTTNYVLDKMAERFNVAIVKNERLTNDLYHYYPDLTGTNFVHYNDLGYEVFTEELIHNISNLSDDMLKRIFPA